jgi:hypothetical protein
MIKTDKINEDYKNLAKSLDEIFLLNNSKDRELKIFKIVI